MTLQYTYLVINNNVILGSHVISDVVVDDKPKQSVKKRQINLLVEFLETRLEQYVAFTLAHFPDVRQIVYTWLESN